MDKKVLELEVGPNFVEAVRIEQNTSRGALAVRVLAIVAIGVIWWRAFESFEVKGDVAVTIAAFLAIGTAAGISRETLTKSHGALMKLISKIVGKPG